MDKKEEEEKKAAADKAAADAAAAEDDDEEEDSEDEDADKKDSSKEDEAELDKELEEEKKRGKPDPEKAKKAFKERNAKRKEEDNSDDEEELDEDERPLTRADLKELEERQYKRAQNERAVELVTNLATSPKEAELLLLKWQNRTFPANLSLADQIEEVYAITHRKKLIGERSEALRALRNKGKVNTDGASTHRDAAAAGEPKLSAADKTAYAASGFVWDGAKRLYKKPLNGGKSFLYKDPKSGRTWPGR